jgi:hypothetical protein
MACSGRRFAPPLMPSVGRHGGVWPSHMELCVGEIPQELDGQRGCLRRNNRACLAAWFRALSQQC